jgi:hypothetical protein
MKLILLQAIDKLTGSSFLVQLDGKKRLADHMKELNAQGFNDMRFYPVKKESVVLDLDVSNFKLFRPKK